MARREVDSASCHPNNDEYRAGREASPKTMPLDQLSYILDSLVDDVLTVSV